ncbi:MAG: tetratricopeptide repeat protein [Bacteroidaceae bacterium]|nr:tetratricopeptide repeat protein [Bacteroidaceae bacterium]
MNKRIIYRFCILSLVWLLFATAQPSLAQSQDEWATKAYAYVEQDSLAQAEACFKQAVEAAPLSKQSAMLLSNLGAVQRRRGKMREAIESYTSALERAPLTVTILMDRATAYMALGNDDKAYTDLCNVLDKKTDHVEALYYRAFIYTHRREYAAARTDYKRLLTLDPIHENGLLGLALLDQREGRLQAAEQQLSQLVDRYPDNATYWHARANVLIEQELYDLALLDLETAITLQPADAELYVARAELYLKMKRKSAAKLDLDCAVTLGIPRSALSELYKQCD